MDGPPLPNDGVQRLLTERTGYPRREPVRQLLIAKTGYPRHGSLSAAARETGVSQSLLSRYVDPSSPIIPTPRNLARLAPYLGVPHDMLMRMVYGPGDTDDGDTGGDGGPRRPVQPVSPHDGLLAVADVLAQATLQLRAYAETIASASHVDHHSVDARSVRVSNHSYVCQPRLRLVPSGPDVDPQAGDSQLPYAA